MKNHHLSATYHLDFYAWTQEQAKLLRNQQFQNLDKEQRLRLEKLLAENPSLKSSLAEVMENVYPLASLSAERETGLSAFPKTCPYSLAEILAADFFPNG